MTMDDVSLKKKQTKEKGMQRETFSRKENYDPLGCREKRGTVEVEEERKKERKVIRKQ